MDDESLLASPAENSIRRTVGSLLVRLAAAVILGVTWPILVATAVVLRLLRGGPILAWRDVVRLPTLADPARWRTVRIWSFQCSFANGEDGFPRPGRGLSDLLLRVLPGLINVVRGDLKLVGVTPRTTAELRALPHEWQVLVIRAGAGLITEAILFPEEALSPDEHDAADACFAAVPRFQHELTLLVSYVKQLARAPYQDMRSTGVTPCPATKGG